MKLRYQISEKVEVPIVIVLNCFTDIEVVFYRGTDALDGLMDEKKNVDVTGFIINVAGVVPRFRMRFMLSSEKRDEGC